MRLLFMMIYEYIKFQSSVLPEPSICIDLKSSGSEVDFH